MGKVKEYAIFVVGVVVVMFIVNKVGFLKNLINGGAASS